MIQICNFKLLDFEAKACEFGNLGSDPSCWSLNPNERILSSFWANRTREIP
jgi:hypothetical protein